MSFLQRNLEFFENTSFFDKLDNLQQSIDKARILRDSSDPEQEFKDWREDKYLKKCGTPWHLPRSTQDLVKWKESISGQYNLMREDVNNIIDCHDDLHWMEFATTATEKAISQGIDPFDTRINLSTKTRQLVCFGTGNGVALQWAISATNPVKLLILVDKWEELISSFWGIDWAKIVNHFQSDGREIVFLRAKDSSEICGSICTSSILLMQLTWAIKLGKNDATQSYEWFQSWSEKESVNLFLYLGYSIDEYNMLINTAQTLAAAPKVLTLPGQRQIVENICICGSGPSLDNSLSTIKELSKSHLIVCAGSSVRSLLRYGIRVDLVVLVERALTMEQVFSDALSSSNQVPRLLMSSTCPDGLVESYNNTTVFFRPALTPLSVFSTRKEQILNFEGPEAVNAAFSFSLQINPSSIVFFGVDLGSKKKDSYRSKDAAGDSPRTLEQTTISNLSEDPIYTNKIFQDTKFVLEQCQTQNLSTNNISVFNASDGAKIKNIKSIHPDIYAEMCFAANSLDLQSFSQWWDSQQEYSPSLLSNNWTARSPRKHTYEYLHSIKDILKSVSSIEEFYSVAIPKISKIQDIHDAPLSVQQGRRIFRSTIYKYMLVILQLISIIHDDSNGKSDLLLKSLLPIFIERIDRLLEESFNLFDHIDNQILQVSQ